MKSACIALGLSAGLLCVCLPARAADLGTAFTYQGFLENPPGTPLNDTCTFEFKLCDDAVAVCSPGTTANRPAIAVISGVFTVPDVDFGANSINGTARWLEVSVDCPSIGGGLTLLSPRVELKPAPHALALPGMATRPMPSGPDNYELGLGLSAIPSGITTEVGGDTPVLNLDVNFRHTDKDPSKPGAAIRIDGRSPAFPAFQFLARGAGLALEESALAVTYDPPSTDCCAAHGGTGCNDPTCETTVCNSDPYCCNVTWDAQCASEAQTMCAALCSAATPSITRVGIGTGQPSDPLTVNGVIRSMSGGFEFPDGTLQSTAATGGGGDGYSLDADDGNPIDAVYVDGNGSVGIGTNVPGESLDVVGNIHASGTIASGSSVVVDGTAHTITSDADLELHVADGRALRIETNATSPNLVGGYGGNIVPSGVTGATIAGGGEDGFPNEVANHFGTVSGGEDNTANGVYATVAGGFGNAASPNGVVSGGQLNEAGSNAVVAGGQSNKAPGRWSAVPGGNSNVAGGEYSFAGGRSAKVRDTLGSSDFDGDEGTFVWADSTDANFVSTGPDQFLIRAAGGVGIGTNAPGEQLDVAGNIHASGAIASGNTITIDGAGVPQTISSSDAIEFLPGGNRVLRLDPEAPSGFSSGLTSSNVIGGWSGNSVLSGVVGATIAGGGGVDTIADRYNEVRADLGTVGGGAGNRVWGLRGTVGGGWGNSAVAEGSTVGGGAVNWANALYATAAGGSGNWPHGDYSAVGGGYDNKATAFATTVAGGYRNSAGGIYSAVPGGYLNLAGGAYGFAAGRQAKVRDAATVGGGDFDGDEGTFAWADSTNADFQSTGPNQFLVRASGGIYLGTNSTVSIPAGRFINTSTGAYLTTGGVWTDSSDRDAKENFTPLDGQSVLERLAEVPISRWNFKVQDGSVAHIGPTAQDFHAAFGTGEDDRHLAALDTSGVALAAIQGLHQLLEDKDCRVRDLEEQNRQLESRLSAVEQLLNDNGGSR